MLGSLGSNVIIHKIGDILMMQVFFQFWVYIRILELISVQNQSRDSFINSDWTHCP